MRVRISPDIPAHYVPVAQLDRAARYERAGCGFDFCQACHMKVCSKCETDYPEPLEDHFNKRGGTESGLQSWCKKCLAIKRKTAYANNEEYYVEKARRTNQEYYKRNAQIMWDHLKENSCIDCGESDPIVLEFDHRGDKTHNVSEMHTYSEKRLREEITKCDVRCANCHRRKTAIQFGWYKDIKP